MDNIFFKENLHNEIYSLLLTMEINLTNLRVVENYIKNGNIDLGLDSLRYFISIQEKKIDEIVKFKCEIYRKHDKT